MCSYKLIHHCPFGERYQWTYEGIYLPCGETRHKFHGVTPVDLCYMFDRILKKNLYRSIDSYLEWRAKTSAHTASAYGEYLYQFAKFTKERTLTSVSEESVTNYLWSLNCDYQRVLFKKAWRGIKRHDIFIRRCYDPDMRKTTIKIETAKKVKDLRQKGLSFRQISRALEEDLKSVYRWHSYDLRGKEKLSTGKKN